MSWILKLQRSWILLFWASLTLCQIACSVSHAVSLTFLCIVFMSLLLQVSSIGSGVPDFVEFALRSLKILNLRACVFNARARVFFEIKYMNPSKLQSIWSGWLNDKNHKTNLPASAGSYSERSEFKLILPFCLTLKFNCYGFSDC